MKTIVITGGSDGIGAAAARSLKALGHRVVIVGRNREKTERVAREIGAPCHIADYSRLEEVVRLAGELSAYERIDVLCNNAGAVFAERTLTADGNERTFQVNVLAEVLLTELLREKLCACHATLIQTSSIASNLFGKGFDVDDVQNEREYTPVKAYGNSKLANVFVTREIERRYAAQGLHAVAFEPGVVRSNFASESVPFFKIAYHTPLRYLFTISSEQSAKRLVRLAVGEAGRDFTPGETYSYKKRYRVRYPDQDGSIASALYDRCLKLIGNYL